MRPNTLRSAKTALTALLSLSSLSALFPVLAMTLGSRAHDSDEDSAANTATEGEGAAGATATAQTAAPAAPAPARPPWTAVASTGVVDETALGNYAVDGSSIGYKAGTTSTASIWVRYNVTNTFDNNANPSKPGWTTLELGSTAPPGSSVSAILYQVKPCTGTREQLCRAVNQNSGLAGVCRTCTLPVGSGIDFLTYLYYVEVEVSRNTPGANPLAHTLRIY